MDFLKTWGVAMGAAWLSGIRLYAGVLTLGVLQHFRFANLPGELHVLGDWWVIAIAAVLCTVEFVADKIPAVDSAWDAVHTFIRVPAGAVLAAAAFGHFDDRVRLVAFLLGGGIALTSHGTKAATRLAVNTSPEPFSNILVSLFEDAFGLVLSFLAAFHPVVTITVVTLLIVAGILLVRKLARGVRALFRRATPTQPRHT
ncbi:MAG TPA: DUF4126 domain-containing protein [Bryobacteraceae bacterium]